MSINNTCPISNFTSEEWSVDIRFLLFQNSRFNEPIPDSGHRFHRAAAGKHCAVLAPRRIACRAVGRAKARRSSFQSRAELTRRHNLFGQRFEARIAMERNEQRIDTNHAYGIAIALTEALLQPMER